MSTLVTTGLVVLGVIGVVFALGGVVHLFLFAKVKFGDTELDAKWLPLKLKTPLPGLALAVFGAGLLYLSITKLSEEDALRVGDVELASDTGQSEAYYNVRCPIAVYLKGSISVTQGVGDVSYTFVRRDGLEAPERRTPIERVHFDGGETREVRDSRTINIPEGDVFFTDALEVRSPERRISEPPVRVRVHCDPKLPPGPTEPPPDVDAPPSP